MPSLRDFITFLVGEPRPKGRPVDDLWDDDTPIPPDHPLVPEPIRAGAARRLDQGCLLHRVQTRHRIEWWILDPDGELIDILWLK